MVERLSVGDGTFAPGYAVHIQRYAFADSHCKGRHVLDAGCGIGYGSRWLAMHGAASVTAVDLSEQALGEARRRFAHPAITYLQGDLHELDRIAGLPPKFDVVVNLENIEHLTHPEKFLRAVTARLAPSDGAQMIVSTPNGKLSRRDADGRLCNRFHVLEYTADEFHDLLSPLFSRVELHGQWETPEGLTRRERDREIFQQLCESYYNPASRAGRLIKRLLGRRVAPPPRFTGDGDSYRWEYEFAPLDQAPYPWEPPYILAVCGGARPVSA